MKTPLLVLSLALASCFSASAQSTAGRGVAHLQRAECDITLEQPLFKTFAGQIPYRIPALATTSVGSIIALSDYRPCGGDIGFGRVDLRYRVSHNNGASWSPEITLAEGDGKAGSPTCGYGDAAIAADFRSGEVIIVAVTGNTVYGQTSTTRQNPNRVAIFRSMDNGRTWSAPQDITESIYRIFDQSKLGPVDALFFASGRICQSRQIKVGTHYRLYAALCARPGGNRVVYSDDFGRSWQALGSIDLSPAPQGDEPKVAELPNGNVVLSSRAWGGRYYNIYTYISQRRATGAWSAPVHSAEMQSGVLAQQNSCNGEIMIIDAVNLNNGKTVPVALQSVPLGPGRKRVCVYYKPLYSNFNYANPTQFASDWEGPFEITPLNSAYSTMTLQPNGRIGFLYEETTYGQGADYTLMYRPLCLSQITGGDFQVITTGSVRAALRKAKHRKATR